MGLPVKRKEPLSGMVVFMRDGKNFVFSNPVLVGFLIFWFYAGCYAGGETEPVVLSALTGLKIADSHPAEATLPGENANPQQLSDQEYNLEWEEIRDFDAAIFADSGRQAASLSLQDCIARALAHNLDIRIGSYDPAIKMADIVQAEAVFDAVIFSSAQFENDDLGNPDTGFFTRTVTTGGGGTKQVKVPTDPFIRQQDYNYALGLRKRLPTGATIELAQRLRRLRQQESGLFYSPFYEWSLDLQVRQPLLRDFGIDLNRATINAARNSYGISQQQFNLLVMQRIAELESKYWSLVFARQRVRILEQLLFQARTTLSRLEQRTTLDAAGGVIARNRGLIERTRGDLISAQNDLLQQQDRLLENINDPNLAVGGDWEIIPSDRPTIQEYKVDRSESLQIALQMRPELIAQRLTIDTAGLGVGVAQNQLLPRLDLIARQQNNGPGVSYDSAWDGQYGFDTISYLLGLSFEFPLGNRAARANLIKSEHEQQQEKLRLENFREQVLTDVSVSLHELQRSYQEIDARRLSEAAEADELRAYLAQESTDAAIDANFLNRKLDAQERLARAQIVLAQTILRYNSALVDLHRAQGTLLHYNNIKLAELSP